MRTLTAVAVAALLLPVGGSAATAARPTTKPGDAVGHLIRKHDCRPGAKYGGGITGWLVDDKATPRRDLRYMHIDNAQQTWGFTVTHHCYR